MDDEMLSEEMPSEKKPVITVRAVLAVLVMVIAVLFATDCVLTKAYGKEPVFCVKTVTYADGVSADYYGAGYKIWRDYDRFENTEEYYISLWILPKAVNI